LIDPRIKDLRNFLFLCWEHLGLPEPTPIQYQIAEYLQNGPKRRIIEAFRGVGKSWITSAYVVHTLLLDPTKNILVVSASKQRSDDFSTFTLRLIEEMPLLQHLRPKENQRNSKIAFDVGPAPASHAPSVVSKGITSQITGSRADLIIADDVESLNNSATVNLRDKLSETIKEFEAVIKPGGHIVYLGTPQTEQSIYNLLPERGYEIRVWPARYPGSKQKTGYGSRLAPQILKDLEATPELEGTPVDGRRFDDHELMEREAAYGRSGFNLQFMLDTTLSDFDRYPLKINDLMVMNLNPDAGPEKPVWAADPSLVLSDLPCVGFNGDRYYRPMAFIGSWMPYTGSVMAVDPSGRGSDETAYAVVKALNGFLYVTACGGLLGGYSPETLSEIAKVVKDHKVNLLLVESNFGDGMFDELLKPYLAKERPVTIESVRHSIQKERRIIDTLEPVMNQHRLILDRKVIEQDQASTTKYPTERALKYQLMYQLSRVSRSRNALDHDDRLDVLSMAVGYWVQQMAKDADREIVSRKQETLQKELDRFMEKSIGRPARDPRNWVDLDF
jgi:hypothetical protein